MGKLSKPLSVLFMLLFAAVLFLIVYCLIAYGILGRATMPGTAGMQVEVVDGFTDMPIKNASVVIPEIDSCFITDECGKTPLIQLPIIRDTHYDKILRQDWGTVTVLVYGDGYLPYALFYTMVEPDTTREGLKIYLFPEDTTTSKFPFVIIEAPQREWVDRLIDTYRPE